MRLSTDQIADLWLGDRALIECPDLGKIGGIVRWRSPGRFGMKFDDSTSGAAKAAYLRNFVASA